MFHQVDFDKLGAPLIHSPEEQIVNITGCTLYYVSYGRNAWHSTWIKRYYYNGCMRQSLSRAKDYAESLRKQGSVMYINPLPALQIKTNERLFFVTQINTETPLKGFSFGGGPYKKYYKIGPGCSIKYILGFFYYKSMLWQHEPPRNNSIICLEYKDGKEDFDNIDKAKSDVLISRSRGPLFLLDWHGKANLIGIDKIRNIEKEYIHNLKIYELKSMSLNY